MNDREGHTGVGIDQGTYYGHVVVQAGMSDDALPYYRCRGCGWGRVGALPDHEDRPCPVSASDDKQ